MTRPPSVETTAERWSSMTIHVDERAIWQHVRYAREDDAAALGEAVRTSIGEELVHDAPVTAAGPVVRAGWGVDVESPVSRWLRGAEDRPVPARAWRNASLGDVLEALFAGDVEADLSHTFPRAGVPDGASSRWALQMLRGSLPEPTTVRLRADGVVVLAPVPDAPAAAKGDLVPQEGYAHGEIGCALQAVWPGEAWRVFDTEITVRSVRHEIHRSGHYRTWVTAHG